MTRALNIALAALVAFATFAPQTADACAMRIEKEDEAPLFALMDEIDEAADKAEKIAVDKLADVVTKGAELSVALEAPPKLELDPTAPADDGPATADAEQQAPAQAPVPPAS